MLVTNNNKKGEINMKTLRKYKITVSQASALQRLQTFSDLKGLILIERVESHSNVCQVSKYSVEITSEKGWNTIVDGKNYFHQIYMNEPSNTVKSYFAHKHFLSMKELCEKDIDVWSKSLGE